MDKMFIDIAIDTVQSAKKIAVDTFVKHEELAKTLNHFVETQTEYTKKAVDASFKVGNDLYGIVKNKSFFSDAIKSAKESVDSTFTHTKGK
jgi:hypothetical protein